VGCKAPKQTGETNENVTGGIRIENPNAGASASAALYLESDDGISRIYDAGTNLTIRSETADRNIRFIVNDGGATVTAMTIDSSVGGYVGIGTATPTHTLNVNGETNLSGNTIVEGDVTANYSYAKNQVAQFHRSALATAAATDTWYNITFDLVIDDETIGEWYELTDSNSSVTINDFEGIIRIQGCIHPYNDNVGNQEATIYARVLVNGIEPRCLQRASSKDFKASGMDTLDVVGTVVVEDGDVITYQWRTTNTNLQLEGDSVFDNPVSASLNFERISNLE